MCVWSLAPDWNLNASLHPKVMLIQMNRKANKCIQRGGEGEGGGGDGHLATFPRLIIVRVN